MSDPSSSPSGSQSDVLLWVAGALILVVAGAWLLFAGLESEPQPHVASIALPAPQLSATADGAAPAASTASEDGVGNPLRMAELAYDAGMLLEPEDYSAWSLYQRALSLDVDNEVARVGLNRVAGDLVLRGRAALEQGRLGDARNLTQRILELLPDHAEALALRIEIDEADASERAALARAAATLQAAQTTPVEAQAAQTTPVEAQESIQAEEAEQQSGADDAAEPDVLDEAFESFERALAANRLIAPEAQSARHFLGVLEQHDPAAELTVTARGQLFDALLQRARQAVDTLDAEAATVWLNQAEELGLEPASLAALRATLTSRLVAAEAARPVPASILTVAHYAAPQYPLRALDRRIEGWVDLEFTVDIDGVPRDVAVTDGSHENFFRSEAIRAVEQWRFEPREFMGQIIEQRSYTRIRFTIEN